MVDEQAESRGAMPDATAIAAAHAIYTPFMLSFYDRLVHGLSNRFAWRCPTERWSASTGTTSRRGISRPAWAPDSSSTVPIRKDSKSSRCSTSTAIVSARSAQRLARYHPLLCETNLLAPIASELDPADSVGLTYVLHCLPGRMAEKLTAIDHLRPVMSKRAVLFGATILGRGIEPNAAARSLLRLYNAKGVFNNLDDDLAGLTEGLKSRVWRGRYRDERMRGLVPRALNHRFPPPPYGH